MLVKAVSKNDEPTKEGENKKTFQVDTLKLMVNSLFHIKFELAADAAAFETEFKKHI